MHTTPNVKIVNKHRESAGAWFCDPTDMAADRARWDYIVKDVKALRVIEPQHDWHIEVTGELGNWHRAHI